MEADKIENPIFGAIALHKEMVYSFVTMFAQLDTFIAHYIASYFKTDLKDKIDLTDLLLADINSQKQFDIFIRILKKGDVEQHYINNITKLYSNTRKLRNTLSHSYLVANQNLNFNGNSLKLTKIIVSKGKGYSVTVQRNEYLNSISQLEDLLHIVYELVRENID